MHKSILLFTFLTSFVLFSQNNNSYWQQHVDYTMEIDVDVQKFQYKGNQKLIYTNNSPDSLNKVFYHLYFNAFQPGSEMDIRLQNIVDPDPRMIDNIGTANNPKYVSRISKLKENEIGYLKVLSLNQNEKPVQFHIEETILEVTLNEPILSGESVILEMEFEGQVPNHIRRAGRTNDENVALSMGQWYPKIAEYDFEGWHADPYIAREFHGVWGDFDVTIHIDKKYTIGGTGYLQNPKEIGHGYAGIKKKLQPKKGNKLSWHFIASNVHDFAWAADPNYIHDVISSKSGTELHFFYKNEEDHRKNWKKLQSYVELGLDYFNSEIGPYPWNQYSIIQAGDGGMEYAMCTFVKSDRSFGSLVGTSLHELAHSWFQQLLANNESKHSWMDEGFAEYYSNKAVKKFLQDKQEDIFNKNYDHYFYAVKYGIEEPLTTHADRFDINTAFNIGSYTKGEIFLTQLNYIIGEENVTNTIRKYYTDFKFKHPTPNDFKRTAEKVSGIQLGWYLNEWIETTHTIDYAIAEAKKDEVTLVRVGKMPMPIDVSITYEDESTEDFYIPLSIMRGEKPTDATILPDWHWGKPKYTFKTSRKIKSVEIDSSGLMADINRSNNRSELKK